MKKNKQLLILAFCIGGTALIFQSCKKDDETKTDQATPNEYIADSSSFQNFGSWPLEATRNGADPSLGMAHNGNDSTAVRKIYFKDGVNPANGVYPIGAIIVKHTSNAAGTLNEYTGMVKRGNGFNPTKGDWEFFVLTADGKIATDMGTPLRGANLMNGMCGGCHAGAANKDYIFTK